MTDSRRVLADEKPTLDPETLAALSRPRWARWLGPALVDWALIVATLAVVGWLDHPIAYALAVFPLGSRQQALGALFHDAAHGLVTRRRMANDLLGSVLAAWPLGLTLGGYRRYHFTHHRALGTDADPEIAHKRAIPQWALPARPLSVARDFGGDLIGGGAAHLVAAGGLTRPTSIGEAAGMGLLWTAAIAVAWRAHALWIPLLWIASIATVFWSGVRLRIWTEHLGTTDTHRIDVPWWFAHFIMPHHIGLHWEHHHWPSVPFWNLGRLRAALPAGTGGAPPVLPLSTLLSAFFRSAPLASGQVGATIAPSGEALSPGAVERHAPMGSLRLLTHVVGPFVAGVVVYLTCRAPLPRALAWYPFGGVWSGRLPGLFVDVFPDAVWSYASTALMAIVWSAPGWSRRLWLAASFALTIGWELGQRARLVPGTYDVADLVFGVAACVLAVLFCPAVPARTP